MKNNKSKQIAGSVAQVVQYLPGKCKDLSSNSNTNTTPPKKKKNPDKFGE
jgi:hypothetical protein